LESLSISTLLVQYAIVGPLLLVWAVGIFLSLVYWRRYRGVTLVTLVICSVMILDTLIATYLFATLPMRMAEQGRSSAQIGAVFTFLGAARSALHAALWGAVLFAIFGWRRKDSATALDV
jgi:hypothetical protein